MIVNSVLEYLEAVKKIHELHESMRTVRPAGWKFTSLEEFVLERGRVFEIRLGECPQSTPRQCFTNSYLLAARRADLYYCEGWARGIIPVHHAWCCDFEGTIYDPTWRDPELMVEYVGVAFEPKFVARQALKNLMPGIFVPDGVRVNPALMRDEAELVQLGVRQELKGP